MNTSEDCGVNRMPKTSDTDIVLTIDLDATSAEATADKLKQEVESVFKTRKGTQSAALTSLEAQMKQSINQAKDLRNKISELSGIKVVSDRYAEASKEYEKVNGQIEKLKEKMRDFEEQGGDLGSKTYQTMTWNYDKLVDKLGEIDKKREALKKKGQDKILYEETEEYQKDAAQLDKINDKIKQQIIHHEEIVSKEEQKAKKQKEQEQSLKNLKKAHGDVNGAIKKGFRNILKWGFSIRSTFILVRKLRQFLSEGFKELQASGLSEMTEQVNELKMSTQTLRNALVGAFEPIVTTIIPYLQQLIDKLIQAVDRFAQLTAAAKGQKTYIKAIRQTGDALKKMGESANKALGPLDDLNVIQGTQQFETAEIPKDAFNQIEELQSTLDPLHEGFMSLLDSAKKFYNEALKPIGEWFLDTEIQNAISAIGDLLGILGNTIELITPGFSWLWDNVMKPLAEVTWDVLTEGLNLVNDLLKAINDTLGGEKEKKNSLSNFLKGLDGKDTIILAIVAAVTALVAALKIYNTVMAIVNTVTAIFESVASPVLLIILAIVAAIALLVAGGILLYKNWDTISAKAKELWTNLKNGFLAAVETIANAFVDLRNKIADVLNKIQIDIPDWVPGLGGKSIGFNIPKADYVTLRPHTGHGGAGVHLAQGTVVPPNMSEFLAVLGDNNRETEVVSPLSTMKEALYEALEQFGGSSKNQEIVLNLDGREFLRAMVKQDSDYRKQHGGVSAFST